MKRFYNPAINGGVIKYMDILDFSPLDIIVFVAEFLQLFFCGLF